MLNEAMLNSSRANTHAYFGRNNVSKKPTIELMNSLEDFFPTISSFGFIFLYEDLHICFLNQEVLTMQEGAREAGLTMI
jgi:hypothetical protein